MDYRISHVEMAPPYRGGPCGRMDRRRSRQPSATGRYPCAMRKFAVVIALASFAAWLGTAALLADDANPPKPAGSTSARTTAEVGFAALRKAAADHDEATLVQRLPASLVKDWPADAARRREEVARGSRRADRAR